MLNFTQNIDSSGKKSFPSFPLQLNREVPLFPIFVSKVTVEVIAFGRELADTPSFPKTP